MAESPSSQHTGSPDYEIPQQLYTRAPRRPQEDMHHHAPLLSSQNPGGGAPKPRVSDAVQRHITETQQNMSLMYVLRHSWELVHQYCIKTSPHVRRQH